MSKTKLLRAIVRDYLERIAENETRLLNYYASAPTFPSAIIRSATAQVPGGRKFAHQWRIPPRVLCEAARALLRANLQMATSFDHLHGLVSDAISQIRGIGELTIYDTAHRIGAYLGFRPEHVYLHAGVRAGARGLGLNHLAEKISMNDLPREFQRLCPEQAEDCLCIYKHFLKERR